MMPKTKNNLRTIPGVDTLLEQMSDCDLPNPLIVSVIRSELGALRKAGNIPSRDEIFRNIHQRLGDLALSRLQPVINGTGVVVHTNLGRSPMPDEAVVNACGHTNLEIDLVTGRRGKRAAYLELCLAELCGAEAATVTNNCAAALVLVLRHFTAKKKEVIISRGELVQIGGGFRIPDILETSDARLREVGTTNRTVIGDYEKAINKDTGLLLKVHQSNFFMDGFVAAPERGELAKFSKRKHVPFVEDLGSGELQVTDDWCDGHHEPTPKEVLKGGADLVCFSGDKLMGGPQAGIIAGKAKHIQALKKHPFFRALRCGKLVLSALQHITEAYLHGEGNTLPLSQCLQADPAQLKRRASKLAKVLADLPVSLNISTGVSQVGGGSLPQASLPGVMLDLVPNNLSLKDFARRLRCASRPVIGTISGQRFRLDLRTILPEQEKQLIESLRESLN